MDRIKDNLYEQLNKLNKFSDSSDLEIKDAVNNILTKSFSGWNSAPDTFIERVDFLLASHRNLRKRKTNSPAEEVIPVEPASFVNEDIPKDADDRTKEILSGLSKSERKFWKERFKVYNDEFNFNGSSDQSLLYQLITEELIQHRLMIRKLSDDTISTDLEMTNSMKRLKECMESLGITRKQRQSARGDEDDGSISQIVALLDKKMNAMSVIENRESEEEKVFQEIKSSRGATNIIPGLDEIKKISKEFGLS